MVPPDPIRRALPAGARVSTWAAADGWPVRRFDWAGAGRGTILFQAGRGDIFEKYLESFARWHRAGWTVTAFDWRGQGGSGRLSADPFVGHADDFAPWAADLAGFWTAMRGAGPRVAIGHSMGGYLILRALLARTIDPVAAVLVAPMLGLRSPVGAMLGERLATFMRDSGDPARGAWRGHERPRAVLRRRRLLTADATRFADEEWWYDTVPALRLGPPSWAWIAHAFAATRALRGDPGLASVTTPLLLLVAMRDRLVDAHAAVRVARRLPAAELLRFGPESAHEILREADPVRDRALDAIDDFLDRHAA